MEGSSESGSGGEKSAGGRTKTQIPAATRAQRNQAEKQRRDRLNGYISELATLVPMVSNASKPLDKVSILRLAAAQMRLNFSCLNPKKFKTKPVTLPPAVISYLDVIEKTIGGFVLATTFSGCIVFCSKSIEDYIGYQNIDVMGNSVYNYIHTGDVSYFEKKVHSVISHQKKDLKKKTKVIKVHMQQRPLPRSNDVRFRKMIFKISVHLNETGEGSSGNGIAQTPTKGKKTGRTKDFGASAVVLMFIEPVRLEPEIDVTYIESHQDAYFTMHGLKGEIIYADQRISSITGYMPHDVQGNSAYQYICSSDVPIALFAQTAMFTSSDGTGVIVYRLRIRDMRFIYLQSTGQIAYKDSTNEISHFVCFNKLLSDDEGSQELKRFQQRFAPQIMAAKLMQGKGNLAADQIEIPDMAYEQAMAIMSSMNNSSLTPEAASPAAVTQKNVFQSPQTSNSPSSSNVGDSKIFEGFVSPPSSVKASYSSHSSEGHSSTSPLSDNGSSSVVSEHNGLSWSYESSGSNFKGQLQFPHQQQDQRDTLSNDSQFAIDQYDGANSVVNEHTYGLEFHDSGMNHLLVANKLLPEKNSDVDESLGIQHNGSHGSSKLQSKPLHSVNAYSTLTNNFTINGTSAEAINNHPMDFVLSGTALQNNASYGMNLILPSPNSGVYDNNIETKVNGQHINHINYKEQDPYTQPNENSRHFIKSHNSLQLSITKSAPTFSSSNSQMNFDREQISQSRLSYLNDLSSFPEMHAVSNSSLLKIPNQLSLDSDETVNFTPQVSSFPEKSSYSNNYMPNNISYNNGAIRKVYDSLDAPKSKSGISDYVSGLSDDSIPHFSPKNIFNSVQMSEDRISANSSVPEDGYNEILKQTAVPYQNGCSEAYMAHSGSSLDQMDWNGVDVHLDTVETVDSGINKELFHELDLFFQNLPETPQDSWVSATNPASSVVNSSYLQNGISSRAKRKYQQ